MCTGISALTATESGPGSNLCGVAIHFSLRNLSSPCYIVSVTARCLSYRPLSMISSHFYLQYATVTKAAKEAGSFRSDCNIFAIRLFAFELG